MPCDSARCLAAGHVAEEGVATSDDVGDGRETGSTTMDTVMAPWLLSDLHREFERPLNVWSLYHIWKNRRSQSLPKPTSTML